MLQVQSSTPIKMHSMRFPCPPASRRRKIRSPARLPGRRSRPNCSWCDSNFKICRQRCRHCKSVRIHSWQIKLRKRRWMRRRMTSQLSRVRSSPPVVCLLHLRWCRPQKCAQMLAVSLHPSFNRPQIVSHLRPHAIHALLRSQTYTPSPSQNP